MEEGGKVKGNKEEERGGGKGREGGKGKMKRDERRREEWRAEEEHKGIK